MRRESLIIPVNKKIKVAVVFDEGFPKPVWFIFDNEKIPVKQICYKWTERQGKQLNYKYTVTDENSVYEIVFIPEEMCWILEVLEDCAYHKLQGF